MSIHISDSTDPVRDRVRAGIAEKRGGVVSPFFEVLLECPAVAEAASNMGASIRFGGTLPAALRELAICIVAAHWRAEYEWNAHSALAAQAGIAADVLDAIRAREPLPGHEPGHQEVHIFMTDLLRDGRSPAEHRERVVNLLGQKQVVELAAIAGYFSLLSFVINTFE